MPFCHFASHDCGQTTWNVWNISQEWWMMVSFQIYMIYHKYIFPKNYNKKWQEWWWWAVSVPGGLQAPANSHPLGQALHTRSIEMMMTVVENNGHFQKNWKLDYWVKLSILGQLKFWMRMTVVENYEQLDYWAKLSILGKLKCWMRMLS